MGWVFRLLWGLGLLASACSWGCEPEARSCQTALDCQVGEACDSGRCQERSCPQGEPDGRGRCGCQSPRDCGPDERCLGGRCGRLCQVGGPGPEASDCLCPPAWQWAQGSCRKACPPKMLRHPHKGHCEPDHPKHYPKYWERDAQGQIRLRCASGWQRDARGQCQLSLPPAPKAPALPSWDPATRGPQKPCPTDPADKWDEDYPKRAGLQATVKRIYVEKSAPDGGDGSKQKPFNDLQAALDKAPSDAVVLVAPGTYKWGLTLGKSLHLVGRCTKGVVLQSPSFLKLGISIKAPKVFIEGLTVKGQGSAQEEGISSQQALGHLSIRHVHVANVHRAAFATKHGVLHLDHCSATQIRVLAAVFAYAMLDVKVQNSRFHDNPSPALHIHQIAKTTIQNNLFERNDTAQIKAGLYFVKMTGPLLLEGNILREHPKVALLLSSVEDAVVRANLLEKNGAKITDNSAAITSFDARGSGSFLGNTLRHNGANGMLLRNSRAVEVRGNLLHDHDAMGLVLITSQGDHAIEANLVTENSGGIYLSYVGAVDGVVEILGNQIANNRKGKAHFNGGLLLHHKQEQPSKGSVLLRHNRFLGNADVGFWIENALPAVAEGNLLRGNGDTEANKRGCVLLSRARSTLRGNQILDAGGCFVGGPSGVGQVELLVEGNHFSWVAAKGPPPGLADAAGLVLGGPVAITLRHNDFQVPGSSISTSLQRDASAALQDLQLRSLRVEANHFRLHPLRAKDPLYGVMHLNYVRRATVRANRIEGIPAWGVFFDRGGDFAFIDNTFRGGPQLQKDVPIGGLTSEFSEGAITLQGNALLSYDYGGSFHWIHGGLRFEHNTWAYHRISGLELTSNLKPSLLLFESFFQNQGRHLFLSNNRALTQVHQSGFSGASPAGAFREQPPTDGVALHQSAQGRVRWVFAKSDYPCSAAQQGTAPRLQGGWIMRPVRVPHALDPCVVSDGSLRTPQQQREASRCFKQCQGRGCRWVWKDVGLGENHGKGLWQPTASLECVDAQEHDSCLNPAPFDKAPLKPLVSQALLRGQCLAASKLKDPCTDAQKKACGSLVCGRVLLDFRGETQLSSRCIPTSASACQPPKGQSSPCPTGHLCFEYAATPFAESPLPSALQLRHNVFWYNQGVDLLLDMAGKTELSDNVYAACSGSSCPSRALYQRQGSAWKKQPLAQGARIVWQKPSPYDAPYASQLLGNDLQQSLAGLSILFKPDLCEASATH